MPRTPNPLSLCAPLLLAAAACATRTGATADALAGRTWQLVELGGAAVETPAGGSAPSVRLEPDGQLAGQGGCNGFGGRWAVEDGRLVTSEVRATLRACVDSTLTAREQRFLALLDARPRVAVRGDTLVLDAAPAPAPGAASGARLVARP